MPDLEDLLLKSLRQLPEAQKQTLVDYAEFLCQRYAVEETVVPQHPVDIPRPQEESVVKAVRRLAKTYPMLDSKELFEKTSSFMMQHVVHGRQASEVIDELEHYFRQQYEAFKVRQSNV